MKATDIKIDASLPFQFISVDDCGETCCPHCGAIGRYIYTWSEFGQLKGAMAGCYAALTGKIKKSDVDSHIERISVKQAKSKILNGWDKTILRMLDYSKNNSSDEGKVLWANSKIREAVSEAKAYAFKKFR